MQITISKVSVLWGGGTRWLCSRCSSSTLSTALCAGDAALPAAFLPCDRLLLTGSKDAAFTGSKDGDVPCFFSIFFFPFFVFHSHVLLWGFPAPRTPARRYWDPLPNEWRRAGERRKRLGCRHLSLNGPALTRPFAALPGYGWAAPADPAARGGESIPCLI